MVISYLAYYKIEVYIYILGLSIELYERSSYGKQVQSWEPF